MRFTIVGAGAIGCLFGAKLTLAGNDVTLIHKDVSVARAIQKQGVKLKEPGSKSRIVHLQVRKGPLRVTDTQVFIVAVKAYDTKSVATSYRGKIDPETAILSLQNGLGNVEVLQSHFRSPLLAGSTSEGALSLGPGSIVHTGKGSTVIGNIERRDQPEFGSDIKETFDAAGFQTVLHSNMRGVLWTKAIVNAAINPITALTRMANGELSKNSAMLELGSEVISEAMSVSRIEKEILVGDPRRLWRKILESTSANKSSMLQDIERGKMTEIRELNGEIVSRAKKARIRVPFNEILTNLVLGLEAAFLGGEATRAYKRS